MRPQRCSTGRAASMRFTRPPSRSSQLAAASLAPAAAEVNAPPLAEFRASDMADLKMDPKATEAEAEQAQERMSQMFHDVRRLMYSYDFSSTCVSSLLACLTDSDCGADEFCYLATSRKKRQLNAMSDAESQRKLLFGSNAVGQCVCN